MVTTVNFKYNPLIITVKKDSLNGVEIQLDSNDCAFLLTLNFDDLVSLYYKIRYFVEQNHFEKKDGEKICITTRISQEKLKEPSTLQEIQKFLHSMTATDVGFYKNISKTGSLFQDSGVTSTKFSTLNQENG